MRSTLLCVIALAAGCATTQMQAVPEADWRTVPPAERVAVDHASTAELARVQQEVQLASRAADEARREAVARQVAARAPADPLAGNPAGRAQLSRIESAIAAWQRATLAWREDRLVAARLHLEVAFADQQERRAEVIDSNLRGDDSYDVATYRGQHASAQERYLAALDRASHSAQAVARASADLASQKEAFAQLIRDQLPPRDPMASLELTGWSAQPAPGQHRRGLRIVSDSASYLRPPKL